MGGNNGSSPDARTNFDLLKQQIAEEHDRLSAEREPLRERLAAIDADLKKLGRMLSIVDPQEPIEPAPKPKGGKGPKVRCSPATLDRIVEFMQTHDPTPYIGFSRDQLAEGLQLSNSSVSYGLQELRAQERVRLVGKAPRMEGQMGIAPSLYKVMPSG